MSDCKTIDQEIEELEDGFKKDFYEEVLVSLGGSLVDVELSLKDFMIAFKKAKRTFIQRGGNGYRRVFLPVPLTKGTMSYDIPENVDTVVKIISQSRSGVFNSEDAFSMAAFNDLFNRTPCNKGYAPMFLEYELTLQMLENTRRYAAEDFQFSHDKFTHKLNLLKRPLYDSTVLVDCYVNLEDEEYMQVDWVLRWTVSEAKLMLGAAYRKFQTVASPTGEVGLSGSEYIQEAREEQRILNEEVDSIVSGSPDHYGVYII